MNSQNIVASIADKYSKTREGWFAAIEEVMRTLGYNQYQASSVLNPYFQTAYGTQSRTLYNEAMSQSPGPHPINNEIAAIARKYPMTREGWFAAIDEIMRTLGLNEYQAARDLKPYFF